MSLDATVRALFPTVPTAQEGLQALVDAELHRRGNPDKSGALHALALRDGALLKEEYDLGAHAHHQGWTVGCAVFDSRELTLVNMHHGFEVGDHVLKAMVAAAREAAPKAKVVRIHSDGFAVLLGPTSEMHIQPPLAGRLLESLVIETRKVLPKEADPMVFTLGLLELTVVEPSHWQVLGPLVWAECERALAIARRAPWPGVMKRKISLHGGLPEEAMTGR